LVYKQQPRKYNKNIYPKKIILDLNREFKTSDLIRGRLSFGVFKIAIQNSKKQLTADIVESLKIRNHYLDSVAKDTQSKSSNLFLIFLLFLKNEILIKTIFFSFQIQLILQFRNSSTQFQLKNKLIRNSREIQTKKFKLNIVGFECLKNVQTIFQ
jgi:hypothetical protein